MKKRFYLPVVVSSLLSSLAVVTCHAASVAVPATSDVTSIAALTLAGVAAVGGILLRKRK